MAEKQTIKVQKIDEWRWRLPREGKMRTDGIVFATPAMMDDIRKDESLSQVANVAWLPGIVGHSLAMPDIHWGYGLPIGGVAAFSLEEGVVSPGGVGYDIN
jgi:tRNA-splicing ligase RtcB